jgi:hypothetical protein
MICAGISGSIEIGERPGMSMHELIENGDRFAAAQDGPLFSRHDPDQANIFTTPPPQRVLVLTPTMI